MSNKKEVWQSILFVLLAGDKLPESSKLAKREVTQILERTDHQHYVVLMKPGKFEFKALYARSNQGKILPARAKTEPVSVPSVGS